MEMSKEELRSLLREVVDEIHASYPNEHKIFIDALLKKEARKQEIWLAAKKHVAGWGSIAVISYLLMLIWDAIHSPHS